MPIIDITVPNIGESVTEVTISQFLVEEGEAVAIDQSLCELESDKATLELPAEAAGTVHFVVEEGDDLAIGDLICQINTDAAAATSQNDTSKTAEKTVAATTETTKEAADNTYATGHPSPAAAKLMAENAIDASQVHGTGVDGRILKEDVQKFIDAQAQQAVQTPKKVATTPQKETKIEPAPSPSGSRTSYTKKMSRLRKTISRRLVEAKNGTAMLTTFNEVDLTEVIAIRKKYKETFKEKHGIGLGFMSFFTKAVATALQDYPAVNSYIVDGDHIEYHDFVDISIAVSTPKGLVVPIIRNAETLSLKQIEQAVRSLAIRGRDGKLTMADMTGGTFTISNGGVFGSLMSTPIINPPQSAILGMHKIQQRAMVIDGEVKVRPMMYLAVSYDHRIIDGKEAVSFLVRIKELLEEPLKLFLDL
ncbi:MAG: 2-oxoglutarate dehydrogenase complex dihydrolipoyllysine-residue succinyltransferase [Chitinophagales bacterium]